MAVFYRVVRMRTRRKYSEVSGAHDSVNFPPRRKRSVAARRLVERLFISIMDEAVKK